MLKEMKGMKDESPKQGIWVRARPWIGGTLSLPFAMAPGDSSKPKAMEMEGLYKEDARSL